MFSDQSISCRWPQEREQAISTLSATLQSQSLGTVLAIGEDMEQRESAVRDQEHVTNSEQPEFTNKGQPEFTDSEQPKFANSKPPEFADSGQEMEQSYGEVGDGGQLS